VTTVSRVFLCHNSLDKEQVKALALVILKAGAVRTWLDTWEIAGGKDWEDHIRREFASSWACVVFLGKHGVGPYQKQEIAWAKARAEVDPDYRVVPILFGGVEATALASLEEMLPRIHWIKLEGEPVSAESVGTVLKALRGHRPGPPAFAISVAVAAEHWDAGGRSDQDANLRGKALSDARRLMANAEAFDALSLAYIAASATVEQRRSRRLIAVLGILAGVFLIGALWANAQRMAANAASRAATVAQAEAESQRDVASAARQAEADQRTIAERERDNAVTQRNLAERRQQIAESQALAADARRSVQQELIASLAKGVSAFRRSPTTEAQTALMEGLARASKMLRVFRCPSGAKATMVALAPTQSSRLVYACRDKVTTLTVVDEAGRAVRTVRRNEDVREAVFLTEDRLALAIGKTLLVVDVASGKEVPITLESPLTALTADTATGALFSGNAAGEVMRWPIGCCSGDSRPSVMYKLASGGVRGLSWRADSALDIDAGDPSIVIDLNGAVIKRAPLFRATDGRIDAVPSCGEPLPAPSRRYYALTAVPSNRAFGYATEANDVVVARQTPQGCFQSTILPGHTHNVLKLVLSGDARLAASAGAIVDADDGHGVILWDVEQAHPLAVGLALPKPGRPYASAVLAISDDGRSWACAGCSDAVVWNGREVPLSQFASASPALAMSGDGRTLAVALAQRRVAQVVEAASDRFDVREWTSDGQAARLWVGEDASFALNADGSITRLRGDRPLLVKEASAGLSPRCVILDPSGAGTLFVDDGAKVMRQALDSGFRSTLASTPKSWSCSEVVYATGPRLLIRLPAEYEPMRVVDAARTPPHEGKVEEWPNPMRAPSGLRTVLKDGHLSTDGRLLVARSDSDGVALFNVTERRALALLRLPDVSAVSLAGNGHRLLTFAQGRLLLWNIAPEDIARRAEQLAGAEPSR